MAKHLLKKNLCLVFILIAIAGCGEKQKIVEEIRAIKTITVTELATGQIRKFSGIVKATDSSALSFEVAGKVTFVKVDIGDHVEKGQVLAVLDKEPYELDVKAAEAEVVKARANVVQKKAEYERQDRVYQKGAGTKSWLDRAKYQYDASISGVDYAVARLNIAKRDLSKTFLYSPYEGHIGKRLVEPHEEVKAGKKIFEIDAEGAMEVRLDVPETTISRIHTGSLVTVTFPMLTGESVKGRITYIGSAAVKANAFPVKIEIIEIPDKINPGMTAEAAFVLKDESRESGYLVPVQAILPAKEARQGYAFVYDPKTSTVRKALIHTRGVQYNMIIISEGLSAGDIIAVAGVSFLADGMKVKLMEQQ